MQDLNLLGMFLTAGPMVKFIMLLLLFFSVVSWYVVFTKFILLKRVGVDSVEFLENFWKCKSLSEAYKAAQENVDSPEATIFKTGYGELQKLGKSRGAGGGQEETFEMRMAGMDNLKRALEKAASIEIDRLAKALNFLATTGSATPFIGLFGTVWGIMSSFQEIGLRGSASLAVVAPGISEALIATAAGLAVAIPAVVFYNYYANRLADLENNMHHFSTDLLNLVERELISRVQDNKPAIDPGI